MKVKHLKEILEHYNDDCDVVLNIFETESDFDEHKDFLIANEKNWSERRTGKCNGILIDVGDINFLGEHWISLVAIDGFLEEKDLTSDRILLDGDVEMTTKDCFHCYYAQSNEDGIHCYRKTRTKVKGTDTCEHYKK